jgi:26S proteasome regulatory subunit T3
LKLDWFFNYSTPYSDEKPDVSYADIGGMDIQKQEVREAVELALTHADLYK